MPCEEPSGHWTTREAVQLIESERRRPIFQCLQDTGQQNPQEGGQGGRDERPSVLPEGYVDGKRVRKRDGKQKRKAKDKKK